MRISVPVSAQETADQARLGLTSENSSERMPAYPSSARPHTYPNVLHGRILRILGVQGRDRNVRGTQKIYK